MTPLTAEEAPAVATPQPNAEEFSNHALAPAGSAALEPTAADAPAEPYPVKIGDTARLVIHTAGGVRAALATVTGVGGPRTGAPVGENGEPLLTVVYLDSLNNRMLSSASWAQAFTRASPVHHASSPAAEPGVVYTDIIPMDASGAISLDAIELPDTSAAAAAEVQRKEAMGVGRGPVPDKDIAFQTATASGVSEAAAIPGVVGGEKETPAYVHTPTPEWPPKTAHIGVPLAPQTGNPVQTSEPKPEGEKTANPPAPATTDKAHEILAGTAPAVAPGQRQLTDEEVEQQKAAGH
jgi:hypothetical protein